MSCSASRNLTRLSLISLSFARWWRDSMRALCRRCWAAAGPLLPSLAGHVLQSDLSLQGGAHRVQRDSPGLITHNPVGADAAPTLECLDRSARVGSKVAVGALRRRVPLARSAIGENGLQAVNHVAPASLLQGRHRSA